ncbi:hypothetical protein OOZ15_08965 [Galbibacter sp. EGI 63066]|nr:hypothetical protein [Galbibacter sp. EGI 63066]MCX2680066.1 hypothetical protein [Galbibacter sp. EGI 63066]
MNSLGKGRFLMLTIKKMEASQHNYQTSDFSGSVYFRAFYYLR